MFSYEGWTADLATGDYASVSIIRCSFDFDLTSYQHVLPQLCPPAISAFPAPIICPVIIQISSADMH
jgi:hypothetical protein